MKPNRDEIGVGVGEDLGLRASVATYNRVVFPHPEDGKVMLALERKAIVRNDGGKAAHVKAQPFGGAVRILNSTGLREIVGEIQFDSERSKQEQDLRILIPPSKWETVKQYCLRRLQTVNDLELESVPDRELIEEFAETMQVDLKPNQYIVQPSGFAIENNPVQTENVEVQGQPTVRLYRIFEVQIIDQALCNAMLDASQICSDTDLAKLALRDSQHGGKGRANSILTLPLNRVTGSYLALPPQMRYGKIKIEDHRLDESVLAVLDDIPVPQYQRL